MKRVRAVELPRLFEGGRGDAALRELSQIMAEDILLVGATIANREARTQEIGNITGPRIGHGALPV